MKNNSSKANRAKPNGNTAKFDDRLVASLKKILVSTNLETQRNYLETLATILGVDLSDCCSALLIYQSNRNKSFSALSDYPTIEPCQSSLPKIKMIRYRLEVGNVHGITPESIRKLLINESGVDKNNISNIDIKNTCTYLELPDDMPQDIFMHLKSLHINEKPLDIRRLKKRSGRKRQRGEFRNDHQKKSVVSD